MALVDLIQTDGKFSQAALARKYGVSRQAVSVRMRNLSNVPFMKNMKVIAT
ncbi:unnamed protein product [marine sediment metagenome]|uniref:HTH asnC-type domain-containing protein n=1 Tax=marine sediment metagenome TaxID=412755 RepID=X1BRZ9_9ZZZZ